MNDRNRRKLPIGFWIKQVDVLLTQGINEIQAGFGLSRTGWQILNTIAENNDIKKETLMEVMQPFADTDQVQSILNNLITDNLVQGQASCTLTSTGNQLHTHCLAKQTEFRKKSMQGISEQYYEITVNTLQQIVTNLTVARAQINRK